MVSASVSVERWLPIAGEEFYSVSDQGRVRSTIRWRGSDERILGQRLNGKGYPRVGLHRVQTFVHHLVAEAFIGSRPEGYAICHCDGNKLNNAASNLRYDTHSRNQIDQYGHGTTPNVLTVEQVREIRARIASGEKQKDLAAEFGVLPPAISAIRHRRTWRWVT
jgi:hypothetical protein